MKILFLERGKLWSFGLPNGLRNLGHTVRISGPVTQQRLRKQLTTFQPNLLVSVGWGPDHKKSKQRIIRKLATHYQIPLVYWSTEDPNFTDVFTIPLLQTMKPDFTFTISHPTATKFRSMGFAADYMDFGYDPAIHRAVKPMGRYRHHIAVVANAYPHVLRKYPRIYRRKSIDILIRPLLAKGYRVDFYGRGWDKMKPFLGKRIPRNWLHGPIAYKDANKVYSSAKIMLGLQNYQDMVTQRTYEILGSSGFLLTSDTQGVRGLLMPGRDLVASSTPSQTIALVGRYLKNREARIAIQRQGRKSIHPHSYTSRAQRMLTILSEKGILPGV
ncbi:peptigoglycan-binding protein LysM [Paenibacillus pectinilyticus]|uniref:Peptigoglycan-binding protein LysM n=1 Tax=Paenibacillus pectinilyticus TaxID=512399 RepID=A0A1C0ZZW6_9BACL|nr:glycosyltransferase [Paenibacillus pectinilyticus]OCT13674.1 peptigoglycan-binding protein LysM [Paenibacillus pectinilyticus]